MSKFEILKVCALQMVANISGKDSIHFAALNEEILKMILNNELLMFSYLCLNTNLRISVAEQKRFFSVFRF